MNKQMNRREILGAAGAVFLPTAGMAAAGEVELELSQVSAHTFRLSVGGAPADDGALVQQNWGPPVAKVSGNFAARTVKAGGVSIQLSSNPIALAIVTAKGEPVQQLKIDPETGGLSFLTGTAPLLGLGEGGPQFDRRGSTDRMRSGQGGYQLRTFGGRVPIQWLVGTGGWAMFVHSPYGTFDFTGTESKFLPPSKEGAFPLDLFFVTSKEPATIMAEYARITGHAELPPLWSFGYQQSHRTLASREAVLAEAKTFREKKLPCDTMIYLGTGFCPSGWNTNNGEFTFNEKVFPDPKAMFDQLHQDHFKVVLHVAYPTGIREMHGAARDVCDSKQRAETQSSCYWDMHRPLLKAGVDGWWPDEGDALNTPSRLVRNRMYWEASQIDRPNERPFALHRNGYAGMQRYGSFLWTGDVNSQWETLRNHVPIAVNTRADRHSVLGHGYRGLRADKGIDRRTLRALVPVRRLQYAVPFARAHLDAAPAVGVEHRRDGSHRNAQRTARTPKELHNAQVEPICRKYLELRYRMMPYLYSAVRECTQTGMPVMRALWLHYPDDAKAVARGDQFLWGRDVLVAPVVEQGATGRSVYLPRGNWYDFWSGERLEGGREITRPVDLETLPLYVRAGAIVPMGPLKQYTAEKVEGPIDRNGLPGCERSVPAVRRRRKLVQLSQGRMDGTRDGLERCPENACSEAGRRLEGAGQARTRNQIGECNQARDV